MANHATKNKTTKLLIYFGHVADHMTVIGSEKGQYCASRDRKTNEEKLEECSRDVCVP